MKKIAMSAALLVFLCADAFAETEAEAALDHTRMAIEHGKAGHGSMLAEHAAEALTHAQKASETATGDARAHFGAAVIALESAINHGKMDATEHVDAAVGAAEQAEEHIRAGSND
ncbi:MAG: small metal-binding protein SmbP [Gammaproteobacteria bacterium]